jgi:hypothetical protein
LSWATSASAAANRVWASLNLSFKTKEKIKIKIRNDYNQKGKTGKNKKTKKTRRTKKKFVFGCNSNYFVVVVVAGPH